MFLLINQYFRDNAILVHLRNFRNFRVTESFIKELNRHILKDNFITLTIIIYIILIAALYYNSGLIEMCLIISYELLLLCQL